MEESKEEEESLLNDHLSCPSKGLKEEKEKIRFVLEPNGQFVVKLRFVDPQPDAFFEMVLSYMYGNSSEITILKRALAIRSKSIEDKCVDTLARHFRVLESQKPLDLT